MANRKGEALHVADYRALAEFRFLLRRFLAFSEDASLAAGLSPQQHQALLALKGMPDGKRATVGDLAARLHIKHHSTVGLVDRLVKAKLLRRQTDSSDARRVALVLTTAGERMLANLSAAHRKELQMLTPSLKSLFAKLES